MVQSKDHSVVHICIFITISSYCSEIIWDAQEKSLCLRIILKNILCRIFQNFVNLKVTQLLIGSTAWYRQSEVVLLSNASKQEKKKKKWEKLTKIVFENDG